MATMLYPTRGGDSTHRNQDWACALAKERNARLIFLYVSNVSFLDRLGGTARVDILEEQLDELGEFLMVMAQERAERSGVESDRVVRHGRFRPAISEVIEEYGVTTLVLGRPVRDSANTTGEYISLVAQTMAAECNVEVFVVYEGEVVEEYQPGATTEG
jgi:nucleotide-binding universal stress UspA family protein